VVFIGTPRLEAESYCSPSRWQDSWNSRFLHGSQSRSHPQAGG
jgi:hypothetical protein